MNVKVKITIRKPAILASGLIDCRSDPHNIAKTQILVARKVGIGVVFQCRFQQGNCHAKAEVIGNCGLLLEKVERGDARAIGGRDDDIAAGGDIARQRRQAGLCPVDQCIARARDLVQRQHRAHHAAACAGQSARAADGLVRAVGGDRSVIHSRHHQRAIGVHRRACQAGGGVDRAFAVQRAGNGRIAQQSINCVKEDIRRLPANRVEGQHQGLGLVAGCGGKAGIGGHLGQIGGLDRHQTGATRRQSGINRRCPRAALQDIGHRSPAARSRGTALGRCRLAAPDGRTARSGQGGVNRGLHCRGKIGPQGDVTRRRNQACILHPRLDVRGQHVHHHNQPRRRRIAWRNIVAGWNHMRAEVFLPKIQIVINRRRTQIDRNPIGWRAQIAVDLGRSAIHKAHQIAKGQINQLHAASDSRPIGAGQIVQRGLQHRSAAVIGGGRAGNHQGIRAENLPVSCGHRNRACGGYTV